MRYILAVFVIFIIPIYLIANDQINKSQIVDSKENIDNTSDYQKKEFMKKKISADDIKKHEEIKRNFETLPQNLKDELMKFKEEQKLLNEKKKTLYKSLSTEAREALKAEKELKKKLYEKK